MAEHCFEIWKGGAFVCTVWTAYEADCYYEAGYTIRSNRK